jgi:uncharacterized metal-binding protein
MEPRAVHTAGCTAAHPVPLKEKAHGIEPDEHMELQRYGLKKRYGMDYTAEDVEAIYTRAAALVKALAAAPANTPS